ncbi:MAG: DUF2088 domain-containing protein, partial [Bacteroidetes bacterium]|nr:DUF2088 domain-containing protein [Bacteroidota bacterium]
MNAGRTLELRYGSGVHTAAVPSRWRLRYLRTDPSPVGRSEDDIITEMLRTPYGQSLRGFLQPSAPLLILIPDKTRRCGTEMLLPRLLEIVHDAGIPPEHIHLLFASGTHPAQTEEEQRSILGSVVYETYQVSEHDASDENACVEVGITRFGTPVRVNRLVA